jgi:glycosyltransferase involved in cell wall biosynthesis
LGIVFTILYPLIILLPKYDAYIFVLTTGRSEAARLTNSYMGSPTVNAFYEPYPFLNNNLGLDNHLQRVWNWYQFYFIKLPLILISRFSGKKIYLETNHLFLKSFSEYALKTFGRKIKVIHLVQPVENIAKSMYEIESYADSDSCNKWYLNPDTKDNFVNYSKIYSVTKDPEKQKYKGLYRCIWYCIEMEARSDVFKWEHEVDVVEVQKAELDDLERLTVKLQNAYSIDIQARKEDKSIDKSINLDEKKRKIHSEVIKNKVKLFTDAWHRTRIKFDDINFSVVIPLYNKEEHIATTILSVLNQSFNHFEIIIVNDGSTDNSVNIIKELNDPRIRIIHQENEGVSAARNRGIKESRYDWIALLDGDDEWKEDYLETIAQNIIRRPNCVAYSTHRDVLLNRKIMPVKQLCHVPKKSGIIKSYPKSCFWSHAPYHSSSVILNKPFLEVNDELNLFPVGVKLGEDLDAWMKLSLIGDLYFINEKKSIYNYDARGSIPSRYNYRDEFPYSKWYTYKTNTFIDSVYIKLCALKKGVQVLKKLIKYKQFRDLPVVFLDTLGIK